MKTITFADADTDEVFNIMAEDSRYLICVRDYTVAERDTEIKEWSDSYQECLVGEYENDNRGFDSLDNFLEYCLEITELEQQHRYDNGDCPEGLNEDTFAYTIVDLVEKIRGADNYYCKFDYNEKEECEKALKELNTITEESKGTPCEEYEMRLSRRNSIELSEYEIKE